MLTASSFQAHSASLASPNISSENRRDLANEVRNSIELVHSHDYSDFLKNYLPAFRTVLCSTTLPQSEDNVINRTRAIILEVLNRLPPNDVLRASLLDVFSLAMEVLQKDNEDNAVTAIHIIFELHKNFRQMLASHVQTFLTFVRGLYESFASTVDALLLKSSLQLNSRSERPLLRSTQSFKVITECPLLVMFVFQLYPKSLDSNIRQLRPLMVRAIQLEVPPEIQPSPQLFQEFIAAQVKTVSFLAYLLKNNPDFMKEEHFKGDQHSISRSVVKLLQACPGDSVTIRKELLVATRHILYSPSREGYFDQVDLLLNESVLVGTGRDAKGVLRPLAYSILAELIHSVRFNLNIPQLRKIIDVFSINVHDSSFSYTLQTSAVRLLMNLIEAVLRVNTQEPQRDEARNLLKRILETITTKYVSLGYQVPRLLKLVEDLRESPDPVKSGKLLSEIPLGDTMKELFEFKTLLKTLNSGVKTILWSLMSIRGSGESGYPTSGGTTPQSSQVADVTGAGQVSHRSGNKGLNEEERELIAQLIPAHRNCFRLYSRLEKANGGGASNISSCRNEDSRCGGTRATGNSTSHTTPKDHINQVTLPAGDIVCATATEERDIFDHFVQIFTVLDVGSFQDVFGLRMEEVFDHIVANPFAISVPQNFLVHGNMSKYFADILLNFLVDNLELLEVPVYEGDANNHTLGQKRAATVMRLFRLLFASVTLFPTNEPVIRQHVTTIVRKSLKFARSADNPYSYLQMLKSFFKAVSHGKNEVHFETIYRDLCPFIEPIFNGLLELYGAPNNFRHRSLIIELCLMIPARQSTIFPYLHLQMKPVMWALVEQKDQVILAIRNLEYWVNMLQPEYFVDILYRVEPHFIKSLQDHLSSSDPVVSRAAARVLGKFGPRARVHNYAIGPSSHEEHSEETYHVGLRWLDGTHFFVNADKVISRCVDTLLGRRQLNERDCTSNHKRRAWKLLHSLLVPLLGVDHNNTSNEGLNRGIFFGGNAARIDNFRETPRTKYSTRSEVDLVTSVLVALLATFDCTGKEIDSNQDSSASSTEIEGLCRYFAALLVQDIVQRMYDDRKAFTLEADANVERSRRSLSPSIFISALCEAVALPSNECLSSGLVCLRFVVAFLLEFSTGTIVKQCEKSLPSRSDLPSTCESSGPHSLPLSDDIINPKYIVEYAPKALQNDSEKVFAKCLADLVERLCHSCYQEKWNCRRAGVLGLQQLLVVVPESILRSQWFGPTHLVIIRSLMFLTRGAYESVCKGIVDLARKMILSLVRIHFVPLDKSVVSSIISSKGFQEFTVRLAWELPCDSACLRETARFCFEELSNELDIPVFEILAPAKEQLFRALFQRSIRQHSIPIQIGYIECINFFLEHGQERFAVDLLRHPIRDNLVSECIVTLECTSFDTATEAEEGFRSSSFENYRLFSRKNTKLLLDLRRKILAMLCNVVVFSETYFRQSDNERLFGSIISTFFRCLQSGDDAIVQSAKKGLKQAILKHEKPKDLLQQNLRPILSNLRDYKKLNIPYLQSLSRVLELFSHWFNVNLGDKLLEHLQRWTEPEKFGSLQKWTPGTESKVGAVILDLFHLLSPASEKFLEPIVRMVIKLESVLPVAGPGVAHLGLKSMDAASTSPYRAPLLRFCNQHASVAVDFFLGHIHDAHMRQLLFVMVRSSNSLALRNVLMQDVSRLTMHLVFSNDISHSTPLYALTLIDYLSRHHAKWLVSTSDLMTILKTYWRTVVNAAEMSQDSTSPLVRVKEMKILSQIFIRYWMYCVEDVSIVYELLPIYSLRTAYDFMPAKDFLRDTVSKRVSTTVKKALLRHFLEMFPNNDISQERKIHALQHIVIPMITSHLEFVRSDGLMTDGDACIDHSKKEIANPKSSSVCTSDVVEALQSRQGQQLQTADSLTITNVPPVTPLNDGISMQGAFKADNERDGGSNTLATCQEDEVIDAVVVQQIMRDILDQPDEILRYYDDRLSAELLRLAAELIKHLPNEMGRHRKELIKFGWGHLKREESSAKHWAFVNVTTFFRAYQAPGKIILQVYVALLRACQPEGRDLVHQALDILTPALPRRLSHNPSDHKFPIWIRYTKKVLLEEGHNTSNVTHILHLIVRHQKLFFIARSQFVPLMANSLSRVGLNQTGLAENRRLSLDIVNIIIKWEQICRQGVSIDSSGDWFCKKRGRDDHSSHSEVVFPRESDASAHGDSVVHEPPLKTRRAADGNPVSTVSHRSNVIAREVDDYHPPRTVVELMFNFLIQLPFRIADKREAPIILERCLMLLEEGSKLWQDVTIRVPFMDRIIAAHNADRGHASSAYKGSAVTDVPGSESMVIKGDAHRLDKADPSGKLKRSTSRSTSLVTALDILITLTRHRGKKFVDSNLDAFRVTISPALTDDDPQIATQFITLLRELCLYYPFLDRSNSSESHSTNVATRPATRPDTLPIEQSSGAQAYAGTDESPGPSLYSIVHVAIESNLNSPDCTKIYSGLLALKVLTESSPQEFLQHHESVLKTVLRLTKDLVSPAQSTNPSIGNVQGISGTSGRDHPAPTSTSATVTAAEGGHLSSNDFHHTSHASEELVTERDYDVDSIIQGISFIGEYIALYETSQRKVITSLFVQLIERCTKVLILNELVVVVKKWVYWSPSDFHKSMDMYKDPVMPKEKATYLQKMVSFERLTESKANGLLRDYLELILRIFGGRDSRDRKTDLIPRLERSFMIGLKAKWEDIREKFFGLYNSAVHSSVSARLHFIFAKEDWGLFGDWLWIRHACELLIATCDVTQNIVLNVRCPQFPTLAVQNDSVTDNERQSWKLIKDLKLKEFMATKRIEVSGSFLSTLQGLLHDDHEIAHIIWVNLFPKIWSSLNEADRVTIQTALATLLAKEYHQVQMYRKYNNIATIMESVVQCEPLPVLRPHLVQHLGARWQAWHHALSYLELRVSELRHCSPSNLHSNLPGVACSVDAEFQNIHEAQTEIFRLLHEKDYLAALRKERSTSEDGCRATTFQQVSLYHEANDLFGILLRGCFQVPNQSPSIVHDSLVWQEGWISSARNLCQWDVLTEFARTVMNYDLLHECLWRIPEWSGMKETLVRHPIEEGPLFQLYQAYVYIQENKMDMAEGTISHGVQRVIERYCALPACGDLDSRYFYLVNLQQFVELQESSTIFEELNAISGHTSKTISIEQKVENIKLRLNTWRERIPFEHEPLKMWSDIVTWRNHMHAVIVNVLEAVKESASASLSSGVTQTTSNGNNGSSSAILLSQRTQTQASSIAQSLPHQVLLMGINETAWNIHRFAKASRKQGFPDMALHLMNKLYPFGTMDLNEYFTKTKELSRAFLARPRGMDKCIENGLYELNKCNMEHFGKRQKAQLFTIKSRLLTELGRDDEAAEYLQIALNTATDVGSTWLDWGKYCDKKQRILSRENNAHYQPGNTNLSPGNNSAALNSIRCELSWREAAVNCFIQAVRYGSHSARPYLSRVLRLLTVDINSRSMIEKILPLDSSSTVNCTVQGSEDESEEWNISSLKRTSCDGVTKSIMNSNNEVPMWMWLPWLSQLICMLSRKEGSVVRRLLHCLSVTYPQAVFYLLRSFLEDRKSVDMPKKTLYKEALKQGRPPLPPNRVSLSLQMAQAMKQMQAAKEALHRTSQRVNALKKQQENAEKAMLATQDASDKAAVAARRAKIQQDYSTAYQFLERCLHVYQQNRQRQQALLNASDAQKSTSHRSEGSARNDGSNDLKDSSDVWDGSIQKQDASDQDGNVNGGTDIGVAASLQQNGSQVGGESSGNGNLDECAEPNPFELADSVMTHLVKSHPALYVDMERITMELSYRLKPQREEHLLSLLSAILHHCYQSQLNSGKEVAHSFRSALADVSRTCFWTGIEGHSDQKLPNAMAELKKAFENELAPQTASNFPTDMEPFIVLLRRWQGIFMRRVDSFPAYIRLENVSKHLVEINDSDVEVFGQYADVSKEPSVDKHVKISMFGPEVNFIHGPSYICRGITIIGTDGKYYKYYLETGVKNAVQPAEERLIQLFRLFNYWIFGRNAEATRRRVRLHIPTLVPIGPRTRLMSVESKLAAAGEGLEKYFLEHRRDPDDAIMKFRIIANDKLMERSGESMSGVERRSNFSMDDLIVSRIEAFNEICDKHVPDSCLSDWVESRMSNADSVFSFRKRFAETLGTACVVGHCLGVGARRPQNLMFSWSSGAVSNQHVRMLTSQEGIVENDEAVPFRLTRNLVKLMGPFGIDGPLKASMITTLMALGNDLEIVRMFLDVIMRDELSVWVSAKLDLRRKAVNTDQHEKGPSSQDIGISRGVVSKMSPDEAAYLDNRATASVRGILYRIGQSRASVPKRASVSGSATLGSGHIVSKVDDGYNMDTSGPSTCTATNSGYGTGIGAGSGTGGSCSGTAALNSSSGNDNSTENVCGTIMGGEGAYNDVWEMTTLNADQTYRRISDWIKHARQDKNLARMETSWQPWY